jgi:ribonuclease P protein component
MEHEKDFPTQQPAAQEEARLSFADEDEERSQGAQCPPPQGTQARFDLRRARYPRWLRLRHRWEFQAVYRSGIRCPGRHMVVFGLARPGQETSRLGVTATRKIGNAVVRSRVKRRLRELFRLERELLRGTSVEIVINARRTCAEARWCDLQRDFQRCLRALLDGLERQ